MDFCETNIVGSTGKSSVEIDFNPAEINVGEAVKDGLINVGEAAKKAFTTLATIFTNPILTIAVAFVNLTGLRSISISTRFKFLEKPLQSINVTLLTHENSYFHQTVTSVAKKSLATLVLIFTNSILSISVGLMKLTGFTIISSIAIGMSTKGLHSANLSFSKYAYAPFQQWAKALSDENTRIIQTDKVLSIRNGALFFNPENYKKQVIDSLKAIIAPISLASSAVLIALAIATKPLHLMVFTGVLLDFLLVRGPMHLNQKIAYGTYVPLQLLSEAIIEIQYGIAESEGFDLRPRPMGVNL